MGRRGVAVSIDLKEQVLARTTTVPSFSGRRVGRLRWARRVPRRTSGAASESGVLGVEAPHVDVALACAAQAEPFCSHSWVKSISLCRNWPSPALGGAIQGWPEMGS